MSIQAPIPAVFVKQEPDEEHPDEVYVDPFEVQFANVFKDVDPGNNCPHCWDQARTMFMAGLAALEDAFGKVSGIRDDKYREAATDWIQKQVDEAEACVKLTRGVNKASHFYNVHREPEGNH